MNKPTPWIQISPIPLAANMISFHLDLLAHRGRATLPVGPVGLGLGDALGEDLGVLISLVLDFLGLAPLEGGTVALVLQALGGDQALDLGGLGVGLLALALGLNLAADDILANIVILGEAEELSDLGRALGTQTLGVHDVGQAGDVLIALLDDGQGEDGHVVADDAAVDGLALSLACAARAVARVTVREEEAHAVRVKDTLLHGEALLVVTAGDAEDVTLELIADGVARDLGAHALLEEDTGLALIFNVEELLAAVGREGNVQLHGASRGGVDVIDLALWK